MCRRGNGSETECLVLSCKERSCFWRALVCLTSLILTGLPLPSPWVRNLCPTLAWSLIWVLHHGLEILSSLRFLCPVPFKKKWSIIPRIWAQQERRMSAQTSTEKITCIPLQAYVWTLASHHSPTEEPIERKQRLHLPFRAIEVSSPVTGRQTIYHKFRLMLGLLCFLCSMKCLLQSQLGEKLLWKLIHKQKIKHWKPWKGFSIFKRNFLILFSSIRMPTFQKKIIYARKGVSH